MKKFIRKNIKRKNILFQQEDIILYNPTDEQLNVIKEFLEKKYPDRRK